VACLSSWIVTKRLRNARSFRNPHRKKIWYSKVGRPSRPSDVAETTNTGKTLLHVPTLHCDWPYEMASSPLPFPYRAGTILKFEMCQSAPRHPVHGSTKSDQWSLNSRSRWPRGLRCGSAVARLLGLRVRIPPVAWKSVSYESCVLSEVSATDQSLVQRSATEYVCVCVCLCVIRCNKNLYTCHGLVETGQNRTERNKRRLLSSQD